MVGNLILTQHLDSGSLVILIIMYISIIIICIILIQMQITSNNVYSIHL